MPVDSWHQSCLAQALECTITNIIVQRTQVIRDSIYLGTEYGGSMAQDQPQKNIGGGGVGSDTSTLPDSEIPEKRSKIKPLRYYVFDNLFFPHHY